MANERQRSGRRGGESRRDKHSKQELSAIALKAGRRRERDGRRLTPTAFQQLFRKRAAKIPWLGGLFAFCETSGGEQVLIRSLDPDDEIEARYTFDPKTRLVGFFGFLRTEKPEHTLSRYIKSWLSGSEALQKLEGIASQVEKLVILEADAAGCILSHAVPPPHQIVDRLIRHTSDLPWSTFFLLLRSGQRVVSKSKNLSPSLIKNEGAVGFVGLLLIGGRLETFIWTFANNLEAKLRAEAEAAEAELREVRPQATQLQFHLMVGMRLFFWRANRRIGYSPKGR
jgi:hypothetical protein